MKTHNIFTRKLKQLHYQSDCITNVTNIWLIITVDQFSVQ